MTGIWRPVPAERVDRLDELEQIVRTYLHEWDRTRGEQDLMYRVRLRERMRDLVG